MRNDGTELKSTDRQSSEKKGKRKGLGLKHLNFPDRDSSGDSSSFLLVEWHGGSSYPWAGECFFFLVFSSCGFGSDHNMLPKTHMYPGKNRVGVTCPEILPPAGTGVASP